MSALVAALRRLAGRCCFQVIYFVSSIFLLFAAERADVSAWKPAG
jgi:hypothetical protein